MRVAIAGGHGRIARLLHPLLVARGDEVRALIRDPDQADDVRRAGAEPVACDLERASADEVAAAIAGCDAVVFAAGAGPGSGAARKRTMDLGGALLLIEAARRAGVPRYVMVSAMGAASAPERPSDEDVFGVYLRAKADADAALLASGLECAIVRPGRLTDEPPTGRVTLGPGLPRGAIPRADVAAVLAEVLHAGRPARATFDVVAGDTPVAEAVAGG